jgi:hypothetical protein
VECGGLPPLSADRACPGVLQPGRRDSAASRIRTIHANFTTRKEPHMATSKITIGYFVQLGGIAAFALGAILSMHHIAIGAFFLGGAAAFYIGEKLRSLT